MAVTRQTLTTCTQQTQLNSPSNAYIATHVPKSAKSSSKLSCSNKLVVLILASTELHKTNSKELTLSLNSYVQYSTTVSAKVQ